MKISKLFHWLYAILMFLPILVFIPNAFYYGFNETAVAQEKTEQIPVYYNSNIVTSYSDILIGNIYSWTNNLPYQTPSQVYYLYNVTILNGDYEDLTGRLYYDTNGNLIFNYSNQYPSINLKPCDFLVNDYLSNYDNYPSLILDRIKRCNNLYVKYYQVVTTNMSISDSMSYAWETTWENDLFSWSYDSFLTQPFLYITNLFNVPATNTLLYCLSYWLNISIIWLCFDVVMYVPLLVHRWLDKGIVE